MKIIKIEEAFSVSLDSAHEVYFENPKQVWLIYCRFSHTIKFMMDGNRIKVKAPEDVFSVTLSRRAYVFLTGAYPRTLNPSLVMYVKAGGILYENC